MTDKQITELNEKVKEAIESVKHIEKKYFDLREQFLQKKQEYDGLFQAYGETNELLQEKTKECLRLQKLIANHWHDFLSTKNRPRDEYKKIWCDMLLDRIEEIAKEKYSDVEYWIDTGSRLDCAMAMLKTFDEELKYD